MRRLILPLCALTAAVSSSTALAASPTPSPQSVQVPISFSCAPGGPIIHHQPLQRQFQLAVAPGRTLSDTVAAINVSKTASVRLKVAIDEATTPASGAGITFITTRLTLARWLRITTTQLTVGPQQYTIIPFQLTVPATVSPGEYAGAITVTNERPVLVKQGKSTSRVFLSNRCDILLRVTGQASAGLAITQAAVAGSSKQPALQLAVKNTGTVIDYPLSTVLTFQGLHKTYRVQARMGPIIGGHASVLAWPIDQRTLPPGTYVTSIQITYAAQKIYGGPPQRMTATWHGSLTIPNA